MNKKIGEVYKMSSKKSSDAKITKVFVKAAKKEAKKTGAKLVGIRKA